MNIFTKQKQTYRYENKHMVTKGETERRGINQELGINIHTTIYKIDKQQGPTVKHRELYSVFCDNLYGKRI